MSKLFLVKLQNKSDEQMCHLSRLFLVNQTQLTVILLLFNLKSKPIFQIAFTLKCTFFQIFIPYKYSGIV